MFKTHEKPTALTFVTDRRTRSDKQMDEAVRGTTHVLHMYKLGKEALGQSAYRSCARVALFEHDHEPNAQERALAKMRLLKWLRGPECRVVVLLPTPSQDEEGEEQEVSNVAWQCFKAPDSLMNMRGTFFRESEASDMPLVMAAHPITPGQKELVYRQQESFLKRAQRVAHRQEVLLYPAPTRMATSLNLYDACTLLREMPSSLLAIDIESIEATGTITAIGISDGLYAVSLPLEEYTPAGHEEEQPNILALPYGAKAERLLRELLADKGIAKVFHNHTFDVPRLQEKGFEINGPIEDTFVAHAIDTPELRHGLQLACANHLAIPPWKSLWHPKLPGINRDDIEYWICDPEALRDYNARDAFYTWHLADKVLPKVRK